MRGFFIVADRLTTCRRCGKNKLAWAKSRQGLYLVDAERSLNGPNLYWAKPWAAHKCKAS